MADLLPREVEIPLADRPDFKLGDALVRPSIRTLEGPVGHELAEPRVMQVLLALVDADGAVVSRDELIRRCWDGRIIGDDSINRAIAEVRRLARATGSAFGIETIARVGYRLTGATIALNSDPVGRPAAISRRWLVGGVVATAAAAGGLGLWAIRRDGPSDGFDLLVQRGTEGLRYDSPQSFDAAAEQLRQAVAIRPNNSRAWGLLAYARFNISELAAPAQAAAALAVTNDAIETALKLDPREPNATTTMIELQGSMLDWATKEDRLRQVLVQDPRNPYALASLVAALQAVGLTRASWDLNERAIAVDPLSPIHQARRAIKSWIMGRNADADRTINRVIELWPRHTIAWNFRFLIFAFTRREQAALAMIDDRANRPASLSPTAISMWRAALTALIERTPATIASAREAILGAARVSIGLAAHGVMMLSALGEIDAAFEVTDGLLLSRGPIVVQPTDGSKRSFMNDPGWKYTQYLFTPPSAAIRADARFDRLCEAIGLTDYWRIRGVRPDYLGQTS